MSSDNRQASSSPGDRQHIKSRSSSRARRATTNRTGSDTSEQHEKSFSNSPKRNTGESNSTKRSDTSPNNRSTTSNASKKQRSTTKTPASSSSSKSKSPSPTRKSGSSKNKGSASNTDIDNKEPSPVNDSEQQDLSFRGLSVVPPEIFDLVTLRRLILSNNNLACIPSAIRSLVHLEHFDISRNPLRVKNGLDDYLCLPREFRYLRNLRTLIMSECALKHIPPIVWMTLSIETLDISRNKIGYIVGEIGNLTNLRHLRLSQMDLDTLPPEIGFCELLETIDLTSNPIDNLPETLVECRKLYEFKINYQKFYKLLDNYMVQLIDEGKIHSEHIPHVIFELEGLQILDLNHTKVNSIPNKHTLLHLNELYLSDNAFFEIPDSLCTMERLKLLDMSSNRIQTIPEYVADMERLEILILSNNLLHTLPSHVADIKMLKKLVVSRNKITTVENGFSHCRSLLALDLSYNNLKIVPEELCFFKLLETLDLRYNQLEYLPLSLRQMVGLKSMNLIDETSQRIGLHLIGNPLKDPPSYLWKSTKIQDLFDYLEKKEKSLSHHYYHLKLILIGPKHSGKTLLTSTLLTHHQAIIKAQKTIDQYVSILQERKLHSHDDESEERRTSDATSSVLTDQWIENRISTNNDNSLDHTPKIKRDKPPPLETYRSEELFINFLSKSTLITKNNIYCTIFDTKDEPSFKILYPLIYDSNALFILPVNLTFLSNLVQTAIDFENKDENQIFYIDYDSLLTDAWLDVHIFRYIESLSDYCQQASLAIVGLIMNGHVKSNDHQQQLLDEIHSKVNMFLTGEENQRKNIKLYSEYFPEPIYLDGENKTDKIIGVLETIAEQWNVMHHKGKRPILKRRLGFIQSDSLTIDYATCLEQYERQTYSVSISTISERNQDLVEQEIENMSFDDCLRYLNMTGDILCFDHRPSKMILVKPYHLLNNVFARTIFRPNLNEWLNYDDNMVFRFSGYYLTRDSFDIDRLRLLTRGEYTWNMLTVLFFEQNTDKISLVEKDIFHYCQLMEHLYLGFLNPSNPNHREFSTAYFVCPWFMNEKSVDVSYKDYFRVLEQKRAYEILQRNQKRVFKQHQIWLAMDHEHERLANATAANENEIRFAQENLEIIMKELPPFDQIDIAESKIINTNVIDTIKIRHGESSAVLPNGLYERLLICLHPLLYERLDYYNLTLGRTKDRGLIKIERFKHQNQIDITITHDLLEYIQHIVTSELFSFYPTVNLRIET